MRRPKKLEPERVFTIQVRITGGAFAGGDALARVIRAIRRSKKSPIVAVIPPAGDETALKIAQNAMILCGDAKPSCVLAKK